MRRILFVAGTFAVLSLVSCLVHSGAERTISHSVTQTPTAENYDVWVIGKSDPSDQSQEIKYGVSVADYLGREEIESLICLLTSSDEDISRMNRISFVFYYRLDDRSIYLVYDEAARKQAAHLFGSYTWNRRLPGNPSALQIYSDLDGKDLEERLKSAFDHTKDCVDRMRN